MFRSHLNLTEHEASRHEQDQLILLMLLWWNADGLFLDVEPKANNAWSNFLHRTSTLEQSSGRRWELFFSFSILRYNIQRNNRSTCKMKPQHYQEANDVIKWGKNRTYSVLEGMLLVLSHVEPLFDMTCRVLRLRNDIQSRQILCLSTSSKASATQKSKCH